MNQLKKRKMDYKEEYHRIMSLEFKHQLEASDYFIFEGNDIDQFVDAIELFVETEKMPKEEQQKTFEEYCYENGDDFFSELQMSIQYYFEHAKERKEEEYNEEHGNSWYGSCCPYNTWKDFEDSDVFEYIF